MISGAGSTQPALRRTAIRQPRCSPESGGVSRSCTLAQDLGAAIASQPVVPPVQYLARVTCAVYRFNTPLMMRKEQRGLVRGQPGKICPVL